MSFSPWVYALGLVAHVGAVILAWVFYEKRRTAEREFLEWSLEGKEILALEYRDYKQGERLEKCKKCAPSWFKRGEYCQKSMHFWLLVSNLLFVAWAVLAISQHFTGK